MNLQDNRNRNRFMILGTALILSYSILALLRLSAEPLGKGGKSAEAPVATTTASALPVDGQYTIGPEDVLQINVWHEPEISGDVPVRPDGKISVPLIGDLVVAGLTPSKLQLALTDKLHAYISNPEVSVTVKQVKSRSFNVLGEVQHPGSYPLAHPVSVLDAISMAGGFRDFAKVTKIYVLRKSASGDTVRLPFNYKQVIKGAQTDQNVGLRPEDTVVVP